MCMLFIKPENLVLPRAYFDSLQANNEDGVSFYNFATRELFKTLDYDIAYNYLVENKDNKLITHFRFGTSGNASLDQLHGWDVVNGEYHFFHNGVMSTFSGTKDLSDTQQFVQFVNMSKYSLQQIVNFLEVFETGSRFMLVHKETQEVIIPNCAGWAKEIKIDGCPVIFSNTYAIDRRLQCDDGHLIEWKKPVNKWTGGTTSQTLSFLDNFKQGDKSTYPQWLTDKIEEYNEKAKTSRYVNNNHVDHYDYKDDDFSPFDDNDYDRLTLEEEQEIDFLVYNGSEKDLLDYTMTYPDQIVAYMKKHML